MFISVKFPGEAQNFKGTAEVFSKNKSHFYAVKLTPEIKAKMKPDFSDIRLFDTENTEIPYIIKNRISKISDFYSKKSKYYEDDTDFFTLITKPKITEITLKNSKISIFRIEFSNFQYIDNVIIDIKSPQLYRRDCSLDTFYRNNKDSVKTSFRNFIISSEHNTDISLNNSHLKIFYLTVNNFDDKSIEIKNIKCYQINTFIVANLKAESKYILKFIDDKTETAIYDLSYFAKKIPEKLEVLVPENVRISKPEIRIPKKSEQARSSANMNLIWIVIVIIMVIVGFFTIQIIKESKNRKT
jgi:hypothetical protein